MDAFKALRNIIARTCSLHPRTTPRPARSRELPARLLWSFALNLMGLHLASTVAGQDSAAVEIRRPSPESHLQVGPSKSLLGLSELGREERWNEAATLAEQLAREVPYDPMVFYWLGTARLHQDNPIGAIQALRSAERLGLDTRPLHETLGTAYYAVYQFKLFEAQMKRVIEIDPRASRPWYNLGRYYQSARSDFSGALKYFEKARELDPEDEKSWAQIGFCQEASGRNEEARRAYETAIALVESKRVQLSLPYQGLARLSMDEEPARALPFALKAVQIEPNSDASHLVLAKVYQRLGKVPEAATELREAIRLNPTDVAPRQVLARIYARLGKKDAAQAELEMIQEIRGVYGAR